MTSFVPAISVWYCPEINELFTVTKLYQEMSRTVNLISVYYHDYYGDHLAFGPGYESLLVFDDRWKKKSVYVGEL